MPPREKERHILFRNCRSRLQNHTDNVFEGDGEISSRHEVERPVLILSLPAYSIYEGHKTKANIAEHLKFHSFATARNALIEKSPYSDTLMRKSSNPEKDGPLLIRSWNFDFGMANSKMRKLPLARKTMHNDSSPNRKTNTLEFTTSASSQSYRQCIHRRRQNLVVPRI